MSEHSLIPRVVFELGPVQVTETVVYSLLASALVIAFALVVRAGLNRRATDWQIAAEFIVEHFEGVMRDMLGCDPRPYTPLVATLALYIGTANLFGLLPAMRSPTADFSTTAALAMVVFLAVPFYGIRARGLKGYLKHYLQPTPLMLPLELISEFSRTLAMAVRLFGNIISEELVIAVLLGLAGLLVPVPMMLLSILTGLVQAYIFAVLSVVYLSAAVRAQHE
ncbi:MAG: F0F1 ATP synthase subunit A [Planctomycetia bacterium]|nr:F0F1 ATP synthase subunit A [Planctomycetia bacterium]